MTSPLQSTKSSSFQNTLSSGQTKSLSSSVTRKFYIEKPQGQNWKTSMGLVVMEGIESDIILFGSSRINILAPDSIKFKWPSVSSRFLLECQGPARDLSFNEYVELVHSICPTLKLPEKFESKSVKTETKQE